MTRRWSITFRGREVEGQTLRAAVGVAMVVFGVAWLLVWTLVMVLVLVLTPVWALTDVALKRCGRRGFVVNDGRSITINISLKGFRRV